ncbi:hypothetical protein EZV73_17535 [Acidaminobacter sp. JC074]|uniref:hypothetical protein n=1 Tax=Acidaminobacter sp. JC074 TaxID=2530199 RepID=UPI001F0DD21E|nr:hypothetical protein [Acidaminobacter sp. JC074]MCH4889405.1 hypothetical protein [Acidaminobacter sp. JC074]
MYKDRMWLFEAFNDSTDLIRASWKRFARNTIVIGIITFILNLFSDAILDVFMVDGQMVLESFGSFIKVFIVTVPVVLILRMFRNVYIVAVDKVDKDTFYTDDLLGVLENWQSLLMVFLIVRIPFIIGSITIQSMFDMEQLPVLIISALCLNALGLFFAFTEIAVILDGVTSIEAIKRSFKMVSKNFFRIIGFFIFALLAFGLIIGLSIVLLMIFRGLSFLVSIGFLVLVFLFAPLPQVFGVTLYRQIYKEESIEVRTV